MVPLRLRPGDDLRQLLEDGMPRQSETAVSVLYGIGSLSACQRRLAGRTESTTVGGDLEILTLAGTLAREDGHLCAGSVVRTTAELLVGLLPGWQFRRELDHANGFPELLIRPGPDSSIRTEIR